MKCQGAKKGEKVQRSEQHLRAAREEGLGELRSAAVFEDYVEFAIEKEGPEGMQGKRRPKNWPRMGMPKMRRSRVSCAFRGSPKGQK